jgi:hypothetical protein
MIMMSSKAIKDHYGEFVEAARREPVIHTNHGRQTLVTISIERAREIPELRDALGKDDLETRQSKLSRLLALAGAGARLVGPISAEELAARSRSFRGNE